MSTTDLRLTYRPALDGLRGVAVLAVVLYHLDVAWLPGGFLGVDTFFVLSGFLITSLLLREWSRGDGIDLKRFWTRRARRLLPALVVVVAVVAVVIPEVGGLPTSGDAVASLLYYANWRFIFTAQSYFAELAEASPFRHMWSLAIEEHFYLLWPLVFVLLARLKPARPIRPLAIFLVAVVAISAILMALLYSPANPSRAYYGTDTRISQIAIGVLAAVVATRGLPALRRATGTVLTSVAFLGLLATMILISDTSGFYYRGGAVLVALIVAGLILALEASRRTPAAAVLGLGSLRWVGKLSYGVYLWHWPVIVYLAERGVTGTSRTVAVVAATAAISIASYFVVEQPIRHGKLLRLELTPARTAAVSLVSVVMALGVVGLATRTVEVPEWIAAAESDLVPAAAAAPAAEELPTIALIGDSVAASLSPGLGEAAVAQGLGYGSAAARGCAVAAGVQVEPDGSYFSYTERCDELIPGGIATLLDEAAPDVVIWYSGRESTVHFLVDGEVLAPGTPAHTAYVARELAEIRDLVVASGAQLRIVYPFPVPSNACETRPGSEACERFEARTGGFARLSEILDTIAAANPNAVTIDLSPIVCRNAVGCDPYVDGVRLRDDGNHFTDAMAALVAPEIIDAVLASLETDAET